MHFRTEHVMDLPVHIRFKHVYLNGHKKRAIRFSFEYFLIRKEPMDEFIVLRIKANWSRTTTFVFPFTIQDVLVVNGFSPIVFFCWIERNISLVISV